ncbi:MAG: hypothetical protein LBJ36_11080 [Synergistaceae bacterium]|jgi:hypothetical protein|nr:hypothetical protein [Synergistaceae bacterium]
MSMTDFMDALVANKYLDYRYSIPEKIFKKENFPLPDEAFTSKWIAWLENRDSDFPDDVCALLSGPGVRVWLEATPAGGIPVVYAEDRRLFERLTAILSMEDEERTLPASVNAFTLPAKHPGFTGHRVICLAKAGYSALSGEDVGIENGEWLEKSATIRLRHECCHYFTLRVLGGMKNHALDEVVADCVGQLSAFGRYDASLQRKFFGLKDDGIVQGGRLEFYVKKLSKGAVALVCQRVEEALDGLEKYLEKNDEMAFKDRGPELIVKLATLGLSGIAELGR